MCSYEWRPIRRGDEIPGGAVLAGHTDSDGDVYVGRANGEGGKLNLHDGRMHNIWCHEKGSSDCGDILVVVNGATFSWSPVRRGDALPRDAVLVGQSATDGDNYACRSGAGEGGKVNLKDGFVNNFWFHGHWFPKGEGDVLEVHSDARPPPSHPEPSPHRPTPERPTPSPAAHGSWNPDAICDGARAEDRAHRLVEHKGLPLDAARAAIQQEFPHVFRAGADWWCPDASCDGISAKDRAQWLMANEGFSLSAARLRVKSEFPSLFRGGGDFIGGGKFPHALSLVETSEGPKLKIEVVANNSGVSLVAVHYQINGGQPMNFDIRMPEAGSRTYAHITPHGAYPVCRHGDTVSYWLAAEVDGLMSEEPEGACVHPDRRLTWAAHH